MGMPGEHVFSSPQGAPRAGPARPFLLRSAERLLARYASAHFDGSHTSVFVVCPRVADQVMPKDRVAACLTLHGEHHIPAEEQALDQKGEQGGVARVVRALVLARIAVDPCLSDHTSIAGQLHANFV